MQYILMIHEDEALWESYSEEKIGKIMQGYHAFSEYVEKNNKMLGGERLQPAHTATRVQVRNGETILTDGPFIESKEQLGGFYLVEADNLDEAVKLAAKIPGASTGTIEVRPVWLVEDYEDYEA